MTSALKSQMTSTGTREKGGGLIENRVGLGWRRGEGWVGEGGRVYREWGWVGLEKGGGFIKNGVGSEAVWEV